MRVGLYRELGALGLDDEWVSYIMRSELCDVPEHSLRELPVRAKFDCAR
jgi:hypothetical protein